MARREWMPLSLFHPCHKSKLSYLSAWISTIAKRLLPLCSAAYHTPLYFIEAHWMWDTERERRCTFLLWELNLRCSAAAAHDLNLGFSSSIGSHHGGPHGITSLKANKHLSTSKKASHAFNKYIHASPDGAAVPEAKWKMQQQQFLDLKKKY